MILIFQEVVSKIPAKLLLIGDGPERKNLEELCRQLNLCDDIRFLGKQDAIEELLALADVFLLPSENESFGLAALEAMACEVPVVSSNAGGIPEVNIEGETGFLCEVGDTKTMAEKVIYLLENDDVLKQFRHNALAKANEFHIDLILPQYEELYERTLNQK